MPFPDPATRHPLIMPDGQPHTGTVFLAAVIDHPRWEVGAYSYASAHRAPEDWAFHLAPYLYPLSAEKLVIGRFCQIADGVPSSPPRPITVMTGSRPILSPSSTGWIRGVPRCRRGRCGTR